MKNISSILVVWACTLALVASLAIALYLLFDVEAFRELAMANINIAIQWETVSDVQIYVLWALAVLSFLPIAFGLYYLRRAFVLFANGEYFTIKNSRDLRRFSVCLIVQAVVSPFYYMFSSVLLSLNHPANEKVLAIQVGSNELKTIVLGIIFLVVSDLLVQATSLENENRQFV
jgi:hypothetical protein